MTDVPQETLVERTLSNLATAWRDIAQSAARTVGLSKAPVSTTPESLERLMRDCLQARGGEVSERMRAAALGRIYLEQGAEGRKRILNVLARELAVSGDAVDADRQRVVSGKRVSVRVDLGGRRIIKKKNTKNLE